MRLDSLKFSQISYDSFRSLLIFYDSLFMFLQIFLYSFKFHQIPSDAFRLFHFLYDSCFEFFLILSFRFFRSFSDSFGLFRMLLDVLGLFLILSIVFRFSQRPRQKSSFFFTFSVVFKSFQIISDPVKSLQTLSNSSRSF